jgi:hypothetical protein
LGWCWCIGFDGKRLTRRAGEASVRSGAERHMAPGIVAPDVKTIGMRELSRIAIGSAMENERTRAFRQQSVVQIILTRHVARETLDGPPGKRRVCFLALSSLVWRPAELRPSAVP